MPKYFVQLIRDEENYIVALCQNPDTASQGRTREEALANIKEAIEGYLMAFEGIEHPEVEIAESQTLAA